MGAKCGCEVKITEEEQVIERLENDEECYHCFQGFFCCVVVTKVHQKFLKGNEFKADIKQKGLRGYLHNKAKGTLKAAFIYLLIALFCLGAMNVVEDLNDMYVTDCKVSLNVIKSLADAEFTVVIEDKNVSRLRKKDCPQLSENHEVHLDEKEYLEVKKVYCDKPYVPIESNEGVVCFNIFKCEEEKDSRCGPLFSRLQTH